MMDMTLQGNIEKTDYVQGFRTFYWHQRQVRIVLGALGILWGVGVVVVIIGGFRMLGTAAFFGSWLPIYVAALFFGAPNTGATKTLQFNGPGGATTLQISDGNLVAKNARSEATYSWDEFTRFREAPAVFVLFFATSTMFLILPKRFCESPAAEEALRQFLIQKLGSA